MSDFMHYELLRKSETSVIKQKLLVVNTPVPTYFKGGGKN